MRETDWFQEIVKRTPLLAVGLYLFLIGPTGQAPFTNLIVMDTSWKVISSIVGLILMISQVFLLWDSQRLPKSELPIGQKPQNVLSRLMLHSSPNQQIELIARTDGLELNFRDYRQAARSRRYLLSISELKDVLENHHIKVIELSRKGRKFGQITIGRLYGWLYNRTMHKNPDELMQKIYSLIQSIVNSAS